ncbi:MAG TPA: methyltransferase domain-containing protein [Rhizomicrobium sp.]|nr:methyltransferase domain-containing protein [Rhizomicrobium sp.]
MDHDSANLSAFYASPLGQVAARLIGNRLLEIWPDVRGTRVLGYGFAIPFLPAFAQSAERVVALIPEQLGARAWPDGSVSSVLGDEDALPFADAMFDRVLVAHGLESADSLRPVMRQLWRVLAPAGKLLVVAPNRNSLWSQIERSPLAYGRPFSRSQLDVLLREALFVPERWDSALLAPPLKSRRLLGRGTGWERIGRRIWPALAGVHIVEATKSLYAVSPPIPVKQNERALASARG